MGEEKNQKHNEKEHTEKKPQTEVEKDATASRVAEEEESGGALPSNHSEES